MKKSLSSLVGSKSCNDDDDDNDSTFGEWILEVLDLNVVVPPLNESAKEVYASDTVVDMSGWRTTMLGVMVLAQVHVVVSCPFKSKTPRPSTSRRIGAGVETAFLPGFATRFFVKTPLTYSNCTLTVGAADLSGVCCSVVVCSGALVIVVVPQASASNRDSSSATGLGSVSG